MKENKKEAKQKVEKTANTEKEMPSENAVKHFCGMLAIGVIVILILILGGVGVVTLVRLKANSVNDILNNGSINSNESNYVVLDDGSKENVNESIKNAEFTIEGRKFYNFSIKEKEGLSVVEATLENVTTETLPGASFKIRIYDSADQLIKEYMIMTTEIEPNKPTTTVTNVVEDCADAARVEVEMVGAKTQEPKSGE